MDIDTLTLDDLHHIVEGFYCFPVNEPSLTRMQQLALDLKEYHETSDEDFEAGLNYYKDKSSELPKLEYDWEHRQEHFEEELGYLGV